MKRILWIALILVPTPCYAVPGWGWRVEDYSSDAYIQMKVRLTLGGTGYMDYKRLPVSGSQVWLVPQQPHSLISSVMLQKFSPASSLAYCSMSATEYTWVSFPNPPLNEFSVEGRISYTGLLLLANQPPYIDGESLGRGVVNVNGKLVPTGYLAGKTYCQMSAKVGVDATIYNEDGGKFDHIYVGLGEYPNRTSFTADYVSQVDSWFVWGTHCTYENGTHNVEQVMDQIIGYGNLTYHRVHSQRAAINARIPFTISVNSIGTEAQLFETNYILGGEFDKENSLGGYIESVDAFVE